VNTQNNKYKEHHFSSSAGPEFPAFKAQDGDEILTRNRDMGTMEAGDGRNTILAGNGVKRPTELNGDGAVKANVMGLHGDLAGKRFVIDGAPVRFGRGEDNDIVIADPSVSRVHAELRQEADGYVIVDRGSSNGTWVNGAAITTHRLRPGDEIMIAGQRFRFEPSDTTIADPMMDVTVPQGSPPGVEVIQAASILRVTISGGGPVGLTFALLLADALGPRVAIRIYNGRWKRDGRRVVWKGIEEGNVRRQQVVTIQSRQFLKLPQEIQDHLFTPGNFTEMWPKGPDSIHDLGPRNIRIAYIEDRLLDLANQKRAQIELIPEPFDAESTHAEIARQHVLAICEGSRSRTFSHYKGKFGAADPTLYGLDGEPVSDMVLGLRVKSLLPDPMAVLLTVAQNRFLLNSLSGEGFLNMRLTDLEAKEAVGIDPIRQTFTGCIQAEPCLLERNPRGEFACGTHHTFFLPALLRGSAFWSRVEEGLTLFGVPPENLTAVTGFQLNMVHRPRFSARLFPPTATTPGTFGFLLGDAANAIHFWPGRGLNSGLASALSLARCLARPGRGTKLRDADFVRHEAVMSMLQYRHKSRAWLQMVTADENGEFRPIKDIIADGIAEGEEGAFERDADLEALLLQLTQIRDRLARRVNGMPDDATLRAHLDQLSGPLIHTLLISGPWDSVSVGGEEVDIDWLLEGPQAGQPAVPQLASLPSV
jgi:FHA domain